MDIDEPLADRPPTSHERLAQQPWDASYRDGPAPWDIGEAQPAVVRLAAQGAFVGPVLDAGCGTGENALHLAALGLAVLGVDVAPTALTIARDRAEQSGIAVEFMAGDALALHRLGRSFASVLDCGLLHTFDGDERQVYVESLASVTDPGAKVYILCFSDEGSNPGPHPLSREQLAGAFPSNQGWHVDAIEPDQIRTRFQNNAPAWLATVTRT